MSILGSDVGRKAECFICVFVFKGEMKREIEKVRKYKYYIRAGCKQ